MFYRCFDIIYKRIKLPDDLFNSNKNVEFESIDNQAIKLENNSENDLTLTNNSEVFENNVKG